MADDRSGRDKKARDLDQRQRERDLATELERREETEPPIEEEVLEAFEVELESMSFPATGTAVVAAVGDREIESTDSTHTVEELIPETDEETFDTPAAVRVRIQRPTVAAAMKRVVEASETLPNTKLDSSQRNGYERTFRELRAIDADDDDEGIQVISDWIVERIQEKQKLPGSREVRRQAAKFCRKNGYEVRNDEWLGI